MKKPIFAFICLLLAVPCAADIIIVDDDGPADYNRIGTAIAHSSNGDYIIVFPGTYTGTGNYNIDFQNKAITVRSVAPTDPYIVAQTIIDCNGLGRGFNFHSGEDPCSSILDGFTIINGVESYDGSIYCEYSHPKISNCVISDNIGGGIYCSNSSPTITNCNITGNEADRGGGIYCYYDSSPTIKNCTIIGNSTEHNGGAIYCRESSPLITNCTITGNSTEYGGGIFCRESGLVITNCTITGNSADQLGGGIFCDGDSSLTITDCNMTGNQVDRGGGIYCYYNSTPTFTNCTIIGNSAASDGGAIYCRESSPLITNCTITGNSAEYNGGGIYCEDSNSTIASCIITGNKAGDGGGIYCDDDSSLKITNCTIADNSAEHNGGGIWCEGSYPTINNSIVWGNTDSSGTGQLAQIYSDYPKVWFSCIQDENPDDADIPFGEDRCNIDDDPCFVEPGSWDTNGLWLDGDYHLLAGSPCIETGDPYYTYHANDVDMDVQPRLMGQYIDMGADEFELSVIVVTKPQAGDVWAAGSTREIEWDSYNITGFVDIYYSDNNGADWVIIDNSVTDTGSFLWHLPGAVDSNQCLVSVEPNTPVTNLICIESGLFAIYPDFIHPTVPSKWKSLGGDFDRAGLSQNYGPKLGCVKWQFQTNGPVSASPTIGAGDRVHIACEDGKLYTLDPDGSLVWIYDVNSPLLSSPSVGPSGSVYVGSQDGKLYAISIAGRLRWTYSTGGFIYSSPAVAADGNVYACSHDGTLYALAQDGSELWSFETAGVSAAITGAIFASPAIGPNGTVYIAGLYDPNLYALDSNDGSVKWSCTFLDPCDPNGPKLRPFTSPVVAPDGTIYQTLLFNPKRFIGEPPSPPDHPWSFWYDSKLYAIDPNEGNIIWATNMTETATQEELENPQPPEPNYWFKKYYTDTSQEEFPPYPFTLTHFGFIDFLRYYRVGNSSWSEPALAPDGTIYVSFDDQYLRAVDPNGTIKWVTSLGWFGSFTLTVGSDGLIYAASDDGYLYVVDPNGKEIARFKGDNWLSFPIITVDNTIIVSDSNNTVWAIGGSGCEGQTAALHRPQDLSADWIVNLKDFAIMADGWLNCMDTSYDPVTKAPYCVDPNNEIFPIGDINRDQYVDFADVAELANRWLIQE